MNPDTANPEPAPEGEESLPPVEPGEIEAVRAIFAALRKTLRVVRLYPPDNRIFINFTDDLASKFREFLAAHHELVLDVNETSFLYRDRVVHEEEDRTRSLPMHLYRDEIRRIAFYEGLTKEEVLGLLGVMTHRPDPEDLEDDLVSLLWEQDFAHFSYFVLDDPTDRPPEPELTRAVKEPSEEAEDTGPVTLTNAKVEKYLAPKLSASDLSTILTITERDLRAVKEMIAHENARNLRHDLTTLLFEMLGLIEDDDPFANTVAVLRQLVYSYVATDNLRDAVDVIRKFRELLEEELPEARSAVVGEELSRVTSRELVEEVGRRFEQPILKNDKHLCEFFRVVGTSAVPPLLDLLPRTRNTQLVINLVAELGRDSPQLLIGRLSDPDPIVVRSVIAVLASTGKPQYARQIRRRLGHPDVAVRLETVRGLSRLGGDEGTEGLAAALSDPEYQVRIHALRCIDEMRVTSLLPVLEGMTEAKEFQARNPYEKQEVFRAISRLGGEDAIPFLERSIEKRSFLRPGRSGEVRAAAAAALAHIPGTRARSLLDKHRQGSGSRAVREACELAVRRLHGADPTEEPQPEEV